MAIIEARELVKSFGNITALRGISFKVKRGGVLGFLGPNGAGKTTALRIITGFHAPDSGEVLVEGQEIRRAGKQLRSRIGYLPENTPLYKEMRVGEYLDFRAALKRIPREQRQARLSFVYERCRIGDVRRQIIGTLSRGYQQRVGLADALIADPPILILDEPTVGLDPNQIREVRTLIQELAGDHTVIFSTHILPEVEAVCERVVIINKGSIVAEGNMAELTQRFRGGSQLILTLRQPQDDTENRLKQIAGVNGVSIVAGEGESKFVIAVESDSDINAAIFKLVAENKWQLRELSEEKTSLEDIFAQLTINRTEPAESAPATESTDV